MGERRPNALAPAFAPECRCLSQLTKADGMNNRLEQIDQLRGLAALGIMCFHLVSFGYGELEAHSFLGKVGLYGVSLFYVISGIAMGHVYGPQFQNHTFSSQSFYIKRYLRLMPLFIVVTLFTIVLAKKQWLWFTIALNLSGLFAFFDYSGGIATGAWSIGNEWVFYIMMPTILTIWSAPNWYMRAFLWIISALLIIFFACAPYQDLAAYWRSYIHPFNHLLFFVAGTYMGFHRLHEKPINWKIPVLGMVSLLVFIVTPFAGNRIELVTGWSRPLLTAATIAIALSWYRMHIRFFQPIEKALILLGEWSYSLYMIHPLMWILLHGANNRLGWGWTPGLQISICLILSLAGSAITYQWIEKPSIALGQRLLKKT
jgi:exopolysaccharide production protein ExoZ